MTSNNTHEMKVPRRVAPRFSTGRFVALLVFAAFSMILVMATVMQFVAPTICTR